MSIPEIAKQMSVNQSAVRRLLWLNEVPPTIIDRGRAPAGAAAGGDPAGPGQG